MSCLKQGRTLEKCFGKWSLAKQSKLLGESNLFRAAIRDITFSFQEPQTINYFNTL